MTLIALSGKIGSAKSTVANIIKKYDNSFVEKSFAYKLKQIVQLLTSCDINNTMTQEGKNIYVPEFEMTIGQMLQQLGTNVLREGFNKEVWIKALLIELNKQPGNYIISDCRFKNEAKAIQDAGGFIIRINRPNNPIAENSTRDLNHQSEIDLDDYNNFDYIIENDSDLASLEAKINDICFKIFLTNILVN